MQVVDGGPPRDRGPAVDQAQAGDRETRARAAQAPALGLQGKRPRSALVLAGGALDPQGVETRLLRGPWDDVVAADGGARHAVALGLIPTMLVGDMDSIDPGSREALRGVPTLTFPTAKNETDSQIAVEWALERGARRIVVAGGLGSRLDHSLANCQLLVRIARAGGAGVITDGRQAVYLLFGTARDLGGGAGFEAEHPGPAGRLVLDAPAGHLFSVIPLGECRGLRLRGCRWELDGYDLSMGDTRTVSNEFAGRPVALSLESGVALVITSPAERGGEATSN